MLVSQHYNNTISTDVKHMCIPVALQQPVVFLQLPLRASVLSGELTHTVPKSSNEHLFGVISMSIMWMVGIAGYE